MVSLQLRLWLGAVLVLAAGVGMEVDDGGAVLDSPLDVRLLDAPLENAPAGVVGRFAKRARESGPCAPPAPPGAKCRTSSETGSRNCALNR